MREPDKSSAIAILAKLLLPEGTITLHESIPRHTQRIYRLLTARQIDDNLSTSTYASWIEAEEAIYNQALDPMLNWDINDLEAAFTVNGLLVKIQGEEITSQMFITSTLLERWFSSSTSKPTYADRLQQVLSQPEIDSIQNLLVRYLTGKSVPWQSRIAIIHAKP
jgi:putative ATPase